MHIQKTSLIYIVVSQHIIVVFIYFKKDTNLHFCLRTFPFKFLKRRQSCNEFRLIEEHVGQLFCIFQDFKILKILFYIIPGF